MVFNYFAIVSLRSKVVSTASIRLHSLRFANGLSLLRKISAEYTLNGTLSSLPVCI
jgi:hypothetical protein